MSSFLPLRRQRETRRSLPGSSPIGLSPVICLQSPQIFLKILSDLLFLLLESLLHWLDPLWCMYLLLQPMLLLCSLLSVLQHFLLLFQGLHLLQVLQLLLFQLCLFYTERLGSNWTEGVSFQLFDSLDLRPWSCSLGGQWMSFSRDCWTP